MVESSEFDGFNFFDFNEFADEAKIKPKVSGTVYQHNHIWLFYHCWA